MLNNLTVVAALSLCQTALTDNVIDPLMIAVRIKYRTGITQNTSKPLMMSLSLLTSTVSHCLH